MSLLKIEYLSPSQLRPYKRNARTHSKKQVRQIADSIRRRGFTAPILIDDECTILAGHARVEAAKLVVGLDRVPCIRLGRMTPEEKWAYVLADNKLALNAGWDEQILGEELRDLRELDIDFDVELTGFSTAEIDSLIEGLNPEEPWRGTVRNLVCEAMMMGTEGASYGYREGRPGPTAGRPRSEGSFQQGWAG